MILLLPFFLSTDNNSFVPVNTHTYSAESIPTLSPHFNPLLYGFDTFPERRRRIGAGHMDLDGLSRLSWLFDKAPVLSSH